MFEQFKGMATGTKDTHGEDVKEGQMLRWMAEDGECYKGVVEYKENDNENSPFIAGFGVFKTTNIDDDVYNENGDLKDGWNGELEIVKSN